MSDDTEDSFYQSPLSRFIQSNVDVDDNDTPSSLSDLLKVHLQKSKTLSNSCLPSSDKKAGFATYHPAPSESVQSTVLKSGLQNTNSEEEEIDDCDTLEKYTKSFLNSRANPATQIRKADFSNVKSSITFTPSNSNIITVNKKFSEININDTDEDICNANLQNTSNRENWNIDLTVALHNPTLKQKQIENTSSSVSQNTPRESFKSTLPETFLYSSTFQTCTLNISHIANKRLSYSNGVLSSFGHVLSKKWRKLSLSTKHKIKHGWPYHPENRFKFDSLSPDDIVLQSRRYKTNSLSET